MIVIKINKLQMVPHPLQKREKITIILKVKL